MTRYDPAKAHDPKMGELMGKIAALMQEYDALGAAAVVGPEGGAEYFFHADPDFSIIAVGEPTATGAVPVRIRAKVADYESREACHAAVQATYSGLVDITLALTAASQQCESVLGLIAQHVEIEIPALAERAVARTELAVEDRPANLTAAVSMLMHRMVPHQLEAIAATNLDEFLTGAGPTLGVQLCNLWQLDEPGSPIVAQVREAYYGLAFADGADAMQVVLGIVWAAAKKDAGEAVDPSAVITLVTHRITARWASEGIDVATGGPIA